MDFYYDENLAEGQHFGKRTFREIEKKALGDCQRETLISRCVPSPSRGIGNY